MKIISHRGNIDGPGSDCERDRVEMAIDAGFYVELDVRRAFNELMIGHDKLLYKLPVDWIRKPLADRFWFHAKDVATFNELGALGLRVFMHTDEPFAVVFPERLKWIHPVHNPVVYDRFTVKDVAVDVAGYPRLDVTSVTHSPYAICTDWPNQWKDYENNK